MFEARAVAPVVQRLRNIANPCDKTFQLLRRTVVRKNLKEREKLLPYLDEFYRDRSVPFEDRLIIESVGPEGSCLKLQGAEAAHILNKATGSCLLARHQAEMRAFTSFLLRCIGVGET
jgi:hypothetical protein